MKIMVGGAGAVGGYFGAALALAGVEVEFLVRPGRAGRLRDHGLDLIAPDATRTTLPVRAVTADELDEPSDLILLAVKGSALAAAADDIEAAVGPSTTILPLLNGTRHMAFLTERFGAQRVLGGLCLVATRLDDDGAVRQLAPGASITFGERDGSRTDRVDRIAQAFAPASFDSTVSDTIEQDMWEKWLFMAVGGAATTLLGGPAGRISSVPGGGQALEAVLAEGLATLESAGHAARPPAIERVRAALLTEGSPFTTSLYRDFAAGHATEAETIIGDFVTQAESTGTPTPLLHAALVRLRVHEAERVAAS